MRKIDLPFSINNPLSKYLVDESKLIVNDNNQIPLTYWTVASNFGDLLSKWIFEKLTGKEVKMVKVDVGNRKNKLKDPCYISIGSILARVQDVSHVWGTGSFGTEQTRNISKKAKYHAVRGPLTRSFILNVGAKCPKVYGDPALLTPYLYNPEVEKTHEVGLVLRWSEVEWLKLNPPEGVKIIDLSRGDIEGVLDDILSCKRIVTSSLHGLIIADSYGIPNSWLSSTTPKGGEFKYYDYFLSVDKVRHTVHYDLKQGITLEKIMDNFPFDDRPINWSPTPLLNACPFLSIKYD